ncbi:MAG: anthranilate phosphoribosyltransferase [Deltaproteobacteria bacterium]|nr:anthranilate phosphoribosyltransferase [Deltaproteobacteria bacterium]MBI3389587.1 anthranilate phosphoribosyltransferase [Deltaproteobacteria bacterium]
MELSDALTRLIDRHDLTAAEMEAVIGRIMRGDATAAQIAGLLIALRMKGETVGEIIGAARALRAAATRITPRAAIVVDTCGTGGDRKGTFNISTAAAFVVAGAGLTVAKHGNRAMSGTVGGADVLEALGVKLDLTPERVGGCIDTIGIGFLFAPVFHPAMKHAAVPRRELGVRTLFNLLGPLLNPAGARHQVVGVFAPQWIEPIARALGELGSAHALVVHSDDGLDEISLAAATSIAEWHAGAVTTYRIAPEELGFTPCRFDDLLGPVSAADSARVVRAVLDGEAGPRLDVVVLNAAAAIYVGERASSVRDAVALARESIGSGRARRKLEAMVEFTNA